jgi:diguanylate cyclase (GGDEF)-like protein
MRIFNEKTRLLTWLSVLMVLGFLAVSGAGYIVSRDLISHGIAAQELPLTGDNIYSELQKDLFRPIFISSLMASDTFLRDWILGGEQDKEAIARYLKEVKERYGAITSFLVTEPTHTYYYAGGVLKTVKADEPRDAWFFRVRQMAQPYEINVDPDMANRDAMTIFINYRVFDFNGGFIGATGVGLTIDAVRHLIESYQKRFQRRIFFVGNDGQITLAGPAAQNLQGNLHELAGLKDIADEIMKTDQEPRQLHYHADGLTMLVNTRFIPELGWRLVVEQEEDAAISPLRRVLAINLLISALITIFVLLVARYTVNYYQGRLEEIAATDKLTGLYNRQALEIIFAQGAKESERSGRPLSAILLDIDLFKEVNDRHGHLFGDLVIRQVAILAREIVRKSDAVSRWGGEEYMVLLKDCELEDAREVAEKLRAAVAATEFAQGEARQRVTLSAGVAQYVAGETLDAFLRRADAALYRAKDLGRDSVAADGQATRSS